jgi:hypothetical protein
MDNKFYVSLEAARLLKEKGYNEETEYTIDNNGRIWMGEYRDECDFPCPTKAESIDWLDSKEVYIQIGGVGSGETQKWSYSVFDYKTCDNYASDYIFLTRLEAEEAAIIKALKLL